MADEPLYYAKGDTIHKRPIRTPKDGGGATITIGFPVCQMTDFVGAEGAQFVADALNAHEAAHRGCMCPHCNPQN